jgi:hypothetical protein
VVGGELSVLEGEGASPDGVCGSPVSAEDVVAGDLPGFLGLSGESVLEEVDICAVVVEVVVVSVGIEELEVVADDLAG